MKLLVKTFPFFSYSKKHIILIFKSISELKFQIIFSLQNVQSKNSTSKLYINSGIFFF